MPIRGAALNHMGSSDEEAPLERRVSLGPSIRTRARFLIMVAFAITLPALLIAVFRAADADAQTKVFLESEQLADDGRQLQIAIQAAHTRLWQLEAEPNPDSQTAAQRALDNLSRRILVLDKTLEQALAVPEVADEVAHWRGESGAEILLGSDDPLARLRAATTRVRRAVDPFLSSEGGPNKKNKIKNKIKIDDKVLRIAHAALATASSDAESIAQSARELTGRRANLTEDALSAAGRDQLVLFLLLLFAFPLVLGFGPAWMVAPLARLKGLAVSIGSGRARRVRATGSDEVSALSRALGKALSQLEENDRLKTRKILETRKLLRRVLTQVVQPIFVIGRGGNLDYVNASAAHVLGAEPHQLEGRAFEETCFAPALLEVVESARTGDVSEGPISATIESAHGRVHTVEAVVGGVQDQQGRVTRVVVVLQS